MVFTNPLLTTMFPVLLPLKDAFSHQVWQNPGYKPSNHLKDEIPGSPGPPSCEDQHHMWTHPKKLARACLLGLWGPGLLLSGLFFAPASEINKSENQKMEPHKSFLCRHNSGTNHRNGKCQKLSLSLSLKDRRRSEFP